MKNKSLAIVIPNYNKGNFIRDTIDSILSQTILPNEIIIVDDCSSDNSVEIIKEYSQKYSLIKPIFLSKNSGVQFARNIGAENARSDYICFVDSDDIYLRDDCIEEQLKKVNKKRAVGVYQLSIDFNNQILSQPVSKKRKLFSKIFFSYYAFNLENFNIWPFHYIFSKQVFFDVGKYNFEYNYFEDADLVMKLLNYGIRFKWIKNESKGYRIPISSQNLSQKPLEEALAIKNKVIEKNIKNISFRNKLKIRIGNYLYNFLIKIF